MKKLSSILAFVLCMQAAMASDNEIRVRSEIKEVTVYTSGASLTSHGNFSSGSGTQQIVFENLSPFIDANSIQAKGEGEFTILSVSLRNNYLNNQIKPRDFKILEDSLEMLQLRIETQKNLRFVFESEEYLLLYNKNVGGQNTGINGAELEKIAMLLRTRLPELKAKELECKTKEKKLADEAAQVQAQMNELNAKKVKNTGEIVVDIMARNTVSGKMAITYNVPNAGWTPVFDLRAPATKGPVKLDYRADIIQNTGVDWKNVKLTLSTGNPRESASQPILNPSWINFYSSRVYGKARGTMNEPAAMTEEIIVSGESIKTVKKNLDKDITADDASSYAEMNDSRNFISYEISIPYNIESDNKTHAVAIQNFSIPADYHYYAAPKLDPDAFLLADITGWDQYNLLSGNMNVFYDDNFVGKSFLNTRNTNDTLSLSLGRDKNIVVTRSIVKDSNKESFIGGNKKKTNMYEISVRNKRKQEIDIEIVDQIPLSRNNDIVVETLETSHARYDKETGKLSWKLKLASAEEKKFRMGYSVKYPSDKTISAL